jgi:methylmalonyl-CoA mutase N-terminal domain/subunit
LAGTQSLHTDSYDEALALPSEKSVRIALRTQQIVAHGTGVAHVADPLGGSGYVEWMTDEMERQAEGIFARPLELRGGSILESMPRMREQDADERAQRRRHRDPHRRRRGRASGLADRLGRRRPPWPPRRAAGAQRAPGAPTAAYGCASVSGPQYR